MKIDKEFILKNLITICCVVAVVVLLLPFVSVSVKMESSFLPGGAGSASNVSGFKAIFGENAAAFGWIMLVSPIVLIAMNYIKQLDKYKSLLAVILPALSIVAALLTLLTASGASASAGGAGASVSSKVIPHVGFFLLIIADVGTLVAGAVTFYGLKFSKEGLAEFGNKLREEGMSGMESLKELGGKAADAAGNFAENFRGGEQRQTATPEGAAPASGEPAPAAQKPLRKTNMNQAMDVLELIKQLSKMKEDGILTEEEFAEKKKELLSQI